MIQILSHRKPNGSRSAGSTLIITVIAMFIITASTLGVLLVTANALHLNTRQRSAAAGFNLAESGAEKAALWLKELSTPPTNPTSFDPFNGPQTVGDGTYSVTVIPDPANLFNYLKIFRIVSVGTENGVSKKVEVVVRQASFGRYAYFTDKETSNIGGGAIWWTAGETVDGPVHSNNTGGSNFNINYNGSKAPIFLDMVTGSGSTINYTPSRPKNESTYKKVFSDGSKGYKLGVSPIRLPDSTDVQKVAAWGSGASFPSKTGVYLKADTEGGIYIQGDAEMRFLLDVSGNQQIEVKQGINITTLTLNRSTGQISSFGTMGEGSPSTSSTLGSGVIYCSGNITSLKGTIADNRVVNSEIQTRTAFTVATDVNAGKTIKITDNLVYNTKPNKLLSADHSTNLKAGTLGLVAKDILLASTAPKNLEINAICLAGGHNTTSGSFYLENYDKKTPTGTLTVIGGIIQKARGAVGTFNSSTGQTQTGYMKDYRYDPRMADNPPPFYPTTGQYERLSWQLLPD